MILTELNDNPSTSVTNMVEILAAELITKHFSQRFEEVDEEPVVLIEHYEPHWKHLSEDAVRELIGEEANDLR